MRNLLYIDFETYYDSKTFTLKKLSMLEYIRDPRFNVFGVGVAFQDDVHPRGINGPIWITGKDVQKYFDRLDWSEWDVCAHNVKFDGAVLKWIYGKTPRSYIDTVSMSRAVLGCRLRGHSLDRVTEYYGLPAKGFMPTDGLETLTPEIEAQLATYCLHDVDLCADIYKRLAVDFPEGQYSVMDWTIRCFVDGGFTLNGPLLEAANKAEKERRAKIFDELDNQYGAAFWGNHRMQTGEPLKAIFSSTLRFPKLLESRGYEVPYKKSPKQKNDDGSAKLIPALAVGDVPFLEMRRSGNEELEALCEARIAARSNLLETRSLKFLEVSKLGTFPFDLNYSGAVNTHRFSGASGAGGNPQNLRKCQNGKEHKSGHTVPEKEGGKVTAPFGQCAGALREAVMAPEGYSLLVVDFNAIEARIVAFLARETALMDEFTRPGGDPYCSFSSEVYQRKITKADKKERQFGKTCILGLGYGMGADKFKYKVRLDTGMVIPDEEAERVVALYRSRYERVPGLWALLNRYIPYIANGATVRFPGISFLEVRDHCVYLPSGLRLQYPNLRQERIGRYDEWVFDSKGEKSKLYGGKLLENISQAIAGELCKMAITRAFEIGINCKGQVHDEILAVVPTESSVRSLSALISAMEAPPSWWQNIVLKAEGGAGPNWLKAKP